MNQIKKLMSDNIIFGNNPQKEKSISVMSEEFDGMWYDNILWNNRKRDYFSSLEKDYEETYGSICGFNDEDSFSENMFECNEDNDEDTNDTNDTNDTEDLNNTNEDSQEVFSIKSQSRRMLDALNWVALFSRNGETPKVSYLRYSHATNFAPIPYDLFLTIL
jgi:hypothetical protein